MRQNGTDIVIVSNKQITRNFVSPKRYNFVTSLMQVQVIVYVGRVGKIMRKWLISVCIIGILIFVICGCTQTDGDFPAAATVNVETENTETEIAGDAESAEPNGSDESNTIYQKPCNTYQDILDNAYEVIVDGRGVDIVVSDEVFSFYGIREALYGRDKDAALAGIGYMFYDEDVPWEMQDDYMAQVKELDLTFLKKRNGHIH